MTAILSLISERRLAANLMTLAVFILGVVALLGLPLAEKPRIDLGSLSITTGYDGASAEDVEAHVTSKLEKELLSVAGIKTFKSESSSGLSLIEIELDSNVSNQDNVYQDIRDAVNRVTDLPTGVTEAPLVRVEKSSNLDFMVVGISSTEPYEKLRGHARLLELKLRRVPGVGEVSLIDLRKPEYWIELQPEQLRRYRLTVSDVVETIKKNNILITGGTIEVDGEDLEVITSEQMNDPEELAKVVLKTNPLVTLKDVSGDIRRGFERSNSRATINGQAAIGFDMKATEDADVIVTSNAVRAVLDQEQARLGEAYSLQVGFDIASEIQSRFDIVKYNGLTGLALVLVALALCLNRNIAFWVALSIPFCLLGTMIVLSLTGQILDSYTMAALVLIIGVIVDDAVVVSERIAARRQSGEKIDKAVLEGVKEVLPAISVNILTTMLAFVPILFLPGNTGKMLYVLPLAVSIALIFSFVDALVIIPSHMKLTKNAPPKKFRIEFLKPVLNWVFAKRKIVLLSTFPIVIAVIVGLYNQLPKLFFPADGAYLVEISAQFNGNQSLEQSWEVAQQLDHLFGQTEEVVSWYGEVSKTSASWTVSLMPAGNRDLSAESIVDVWQERSSAFEGFLEVEYDVDTGGAPLGRPVDLQVVGGNDKARQEAADWIVNWLENFEAVTEPGQSKADTVTQLKLDVDYSLLNQLAVPLDTLAQTIRLAIEGERVSRVFDGNEEVFFRLVLEENDRTPEEMRHLLIPNTKGELITLGEVVRWKTGEREEVISHFNGERSIRVSSTLDDSLTDPIAVEDALLQAISGQIDPTISVVSVGQARETREAMEGLALAMAIAVIAIGAVMILLFDRVSDALVGLSIVPIGVACALLVLWLHGKPLSFFASVGIIGMIGIAVNNALVLLHHYHNTVFSSDAGMRRAQLLDGALSRVRPMFITTLTTVAGLLPLAYGLGGYDNLISPIALVIGWGILLTAPFVLMLVPAAYSLLLEQRFRET